MSEDSTYDTLEPSTGGSSKLIPSKTQLTGLLIGLTTVGLNNYYTRKPFYYGIHYYVGAGFLGVYIFTQIEKYRLDQKRKKLLVMEDYMRLHPEYFQEQYKKKFADVLIPWDPTR